MLRLFYCFDFIVFIGFYGYFSVRFRVCLFFIVIVRRFCYGGFSDYFYFLVKVFVGRAGFAVLGVRYGG